MDFVEQLQALALKTGKLCSLLQTEEATKNALIMPFINLLDFDIFDPTEVIPEFVADVGIKKGEKVDYAVKMDDKIIMLFECKHCGGDLNIKHASQLFRYFSVTEARIAVLTNGLVYRFFTDLDAPNKMDDRPFLEVDMTDLSDVAINELKKLRKSVFNIEDIIASAGELTYTHQIKKLINEQIEKPSDEFVKLFASKVYDGILTPARRDYFSDLTRRSFKQLIHERINERLKSVISGSDESLQAEEEASSESNARENTVETSADELEGFYIIKSLLRDMVDPKRIIHRDTQSYMGILLDDNNRKPLARLHFNRSQKYVGIFDEKRSEEKVAIQNLNDIYQHAEKLRRVFAFYEREEIGGAKSSETENSNAENLQV